MDQAGSQHAQLSSSQRPLPLVARLDLIVAEMNSGDSTFAVIKDPVSLQYFRLQPEQFSVLQSLNGNKSLQDLREGLQEQFPGSPITLADIRGLITDLHEKGLVNSLRADQGSRLLERAGKTYWKKARQAVMNPLYVRLPGWDPERLLGWLLRFMSWMFHPAVVLTVLAIDAAALLLLAVRFDDVARRMPEFHQFFGWPNVALLWVSMAGAKLLHEFGHGLACRFFGAECHSMGVMLLVFSPTLYCDVTDSWMLPNKWKRIAIGAAGMYVEVLLASLAMFVWWTTRPGLLNHLCLNVFFVSTVTTVIFNANPLMRYDGYYMLSDWLEIPNLRQKASRMVQELTSQWCLGVELPQDPFMPAQRRRWFVIYAVATTVYQLVILLGITVFLYSVLKPYRLQSLGITVAVTSLVTIVLAYLRSLWKLIVMPRQEPLSKWRLSATFSVLALLITGILQIPMPWYAEAPFTVEPARPVAVYAHVPGLLKAIHKQAGDRVEAGELILELENEGLEEAVRKLKAEVASQIRELDAWKVLDRSREVQVAEQHLAALQTQQAEAEAILRDCEVRAPVSGVIVAPPRQLDDAHSSEQLSRWIGTPLERRNLGCEIAPRTLLFNIAESDEYQALLLVDQADRRELEVGQPVRLKLEHLPSATLEGRVQTISDRSLEYAPATLSNKYGGPLPTVHESGGRERLMSPAFEACVPVSLDRELLRTGMRGRARVVIADRTAWDWSWRWFRRTFQLNI